MNDPNAGPGHYRYLTFNAPLSDARADAIVRRLVAPAPAEVLDIGCGWGELLLRVVEAAPRCSGVGVDTDERVLARGRAAAEVRGLADRVTFRNAPGDRAHGPADVVICIGATHAFGDTARALTALRALVRPGGRLLLGEATWEPGGPVNERFVWPDMLDLPPLAGLVDLSVAAGFRPLWMETANGDEWEAFESGYLADTEEWLLTHAGHPEALKHGAEADERRTRWLHGYRAGLGYAYLTLGRPHA